MRKLFPDNGADGFEACFVREVPAELLGGHRHGEDLHVRGRHDELVGVAGIDRLAGGQRVDARGDEAARQGGVIEYRIELTRQ